MARGIYDSLNFEQKKLKMVEENFFKSYIYSSLNVLEYVLL
jgi:hypothetical protein